ncbi:MAG: VWD domain-containing protein [Nostocaceae cyanobacterium]|nr:VWD domain-containing protein [Nostocaceae cyanobacterium]
MKNIWKLTQGIAVLNFIFASFSPIASSAPPKKQQQNSHSNTVNAENIRGCYGSEEKKSKSLQDSKLLNTKDDTVLAFKANDEDYGHIHIAREALRKTSVGIQDSSNSSLQFTDSAIQQIINADVSVDLAPGIKVFSDDFYVPLKHFDNECLKEGSEYLIETKKQIIGILEPIKDANSGKKSGIEARKLLGKALHTLQDFYAHTNWVELGFDDIDTRLGRKVIPSPPIDRPTSEVVGFAEVAAVKEFLKGNLSSDPRLLILSKLANFAAIISHNSPYDIASYISPKPGKLKKEFIGTKDKEYLTSGYFMGIGPVDSCKVPLGKTRHGADIFLCPSGLNKDERQRPNYKKASQLAMKASIDYINQIIKESPTIRDNPEAIKALMGIENSKKPLQEKREGRELKSGKSWGDPHLITFDGLSYNFQTVGEFILAKSKDGDVEVQTRQTPVNSNLSLNSAVAIRVGSDRVAIYAQDLPDADTSTQLRVNGKPVVIEGNKVALSSGGAIAKNGGTYIVNLPSGEKVVVTASTFNGKSYLDIVIYVYNQPNRMSGLLGNLDGNRDNDQISRDGNVLSSRSTYGNLKDVLNLVGVGKLPVNLDAADKLYLDKLYKDFGNSWRVKQQESLFDYPTGMTTANYTDKNFPKNYLTLDMLSTEQIAKAQNACEKAKVTQDMMSGCIYDVGFTGFSHFARTTAQINGYLDIANQLFPGRGIGNIQVKKGFMGIPNEVCLPFIGCKKILPF